MRIQYMVKKYSILKFINYGPTFDYLTGSYQRERDGAVQEAGKGEEKLWLVCLLGFRLA